MIYGNGKTTFSNGESLDMGMSIGLARQMSQMNNAFSHLTLSERILAGTSAMMARTMVTPGITAAIELNSLGGKLNPLNKSAVLLRDLIPSVSIIKALGQFDWYQRDIVNRRALQDALIPKGLWQTYRALSDNYLLAGRGLNKFITQYPAAKTFVTDQKIISAFEQDIEYIKELANWDWLEELEQLALFARELFDKTTALGMHAKEKTHEEIALHLEVMSPYIKKWGEKYTVAKIIQAIIDFIMYF